MPELTELERDLAAMLRNRADRTPRHPDAQGTAVVVGRARRRRAVNVAFAGTLALVLAVAVGGLLASGALRDRDRTLPAPPVHQPTALVAVSAGQGWLAAIAPGGRATRFLAKGTDTTGLDFASPAWSPDGSRLAFLAGDIGSGPVGDLAVFVANADGTGMRKVVDCPGKGSCGIERTAGLSWSPDGSRLALVGDGLYVLDVDAGRLQQLTAAPVAAAPAWSPDGTRIAYARRADVQVVEVDGAVTATVNDLTDAETIDWSPDGTRLAVSAGGGIYLAALGRPPTVTVTAEKVVAQRTGEGPGAASWSPDGRSLSYFSTPRTSDGFIAQLRLLDVATGDDRVLYESPCCVAIWSPPAWSPDGTQLALSLGIDGASPSESGLFVVPADGSGAERWTAAVLTDPTWRPLR